MSLSVQNKVSTDRLVVMPLGGPRSGVVRLARVKFIVYINVFNNASQSVYKQFHSTETALLKVHNDINLNIDNGKVTALE